MDPNPECELRRKISQHVTAVLFLVALSGYDQSLIEDRDSVGDRAKDFDESLAQFLLR